MRLALALVIGLAGGIAAFPAVALAQVPATESAPATAQPALPDPLEAGKQALSKGDYGTAQQLITAYVKDNPNNADARYLAGNASLGLKQYDDAAQSYLAAIKLQPSLWAAHKNLVIAYAAQEKWSDFDREREVIQKARTSGAAGLSNRDADVIDVLYVGTERYIVRSFAELNGRFKARYNIAHFAPNGKPDFWILCESDDIDQISFAKAHPTEAAAGQRSFSLDSYTAPTPTADGKSYTQTHGTIKFYPDGEPQLRNGAYGHFAGSATQSGAHEFHHIGQTRYSEPIKARQSAGVMTMVVPTAGEAAQDLRAKFGPGCG